MHVMGKIGVWLVVIAAAASTVLTAKLVQVRNSWTRRSVENQKQMETLRPKIAELKQQVAQLEAEYFRSRELWGHYWNNVPTQVLRPTEGVLTINIGLNNGLREKQYLYGFEILPDGSSIYRGDFTVVTARDVQAQLQPNWRVRPEDVQTWQPNANWRWRNLIPPGSQSTYDQQILAIAKSDDLLTLRREKLAAEGVSEAKAQAALKLRESELVGGDELSKDPAEAIENREGLVAAVEQIEEERNEVLQQVDDLRRRLRAVQQKIETQRATNLELAGRLPQPATTVGSKD